MRSRNVVFLLFCLVLVACKEHPSFSKIDRSFQLPEILDTSKFRQVDFNQYEELQLGKIKEIKDFDSFNFYYGDTISLGNGEYLREIYATTSNEGNIYLISYNIDDYFVNYVRVAYFDWAQYYRTISSVLKKNELTVQLFEYSYDEVNVEERTDTIITKYEIDPDLNFIEQR